MIMVIKILMIMIALVIVMKNIVTNTNATDGYNSNVHRSDIITLS